MLCGVSEALQFVRGWCWRTGLDLQVLLLVAEPAVLKHREIKLIPHKQLGVPVAEAESSS